VTFIAPNLTVGRPDAPTTFWAWILGAVKYPDANNNNLISAKKRRLAGDYPNNAAKPGCAGILA